MKRETVFKTILKRIPLSYYWMQRQSIGDNVRTILDIGCGEGELMENLILGKKWKITGIDIFSDAVNKARKTGVYHEVIKADITKINYVLGKKKFDVVFSSQIIEHLKKREGRVALSLWEKFAKKRVVISTPVGFTTYTSIGSSVEEKNPYQKHLSGWSIENFREMGYKVRGQGVGFIYGDNGLARRFPNLSIFWQILSYILSPVVYFNPRYAFIMVCKKEINEK